MGRSLCPPELWPQFSTLLDEALDLPQSERELWLASLDAQYAAVVPWLAAALTPGTRLSEAGFLQAPVQMPDAVAALSSQFTAGEHLGPYLLEQAIGSGGMGEVWLASRSDGSLTRKVALKLPHAYLMGGVQRRRFERERDILAALSHPSIAQLYDAGVADCGHPYLAMEWIDGVSITEHCDQARLPLQARLDLFLQILDAVGYAHGRLIAHRDLKPGNILVSRDGKVKLLDFGIAKLLTEDAEHGATQLTRMGAAIATPNYAAPEQLAGEPITAAVDIYAVGVILYELLTGRRPFQDARSAIRAGTLPPLASSQIDAEHAARVGGLDAQQLRRALKGDLDAIAATALEALPLRRYHTAEAFALDIRHSREHEPIVARPITPATRALKLVRRHRFGAALTAALSLAVVGGSAGIAWQGVRAQREAQRATTIKDFLVDVFRASDPRIGSDRPRGQITARELLDVSSDRIESSFARQPATQVELLGVVADIYRELDELQRSSELYAREAELSRQYLGTRDSHAIDGLLGQAYDAELNNQEARALELLAQADTTIHDAGLDRSALRARWWMIRGETLAPDRSRAREAPTSLEKGAELFKAVAPGDPFYADDLLDLGVLSMEGGDFAASARYNREAISVARTSPQAEGQLLPANQGLAEALKNLGDFTGAAAAYEQGAKLALRTYGTASPKYWLIASDGTRFRYDRGDREAALRAFEQLLGQLPNDRAGYRSAADVLNGAIVLRDYGRSLTTDGQTGRAIALLERARDLLPTSTSRSLVSLVIQGDLGRAYAAAGRTDEAHAALLGVLQALSQTHGSVLQLSIAHWRWGHFLQSQGDLQGAQTEFDEVLRLAAGHVSEPAIYARTSLAELALRRGDTRAALAVSALAMAELSRIEGSYDIRIEPMIWKVRAQALQLSGDLSSARALAQRALDADTLYYDSQSAELRDAQALLTSLAH
jgi:tetratricopeptide (TPR) repeat protein/tRNA A-37 threonylcarbamoyl transferase component Bud32